MKRHKHRINSSDIPVIFSDGSAVYRKLAEEYITHNHGYFILAPSGSGKTYFVNHQNEKHWIDGDVLWPITGADYSDDEWGDDPEDVQIINLRSDVITMEAKKLGFWIIGSSNSFLKPDAIVIPDLETHKKFIATRQSNSATFDGGATLDDIEGVQNHIAWIKKQWPEKNVPYFSSVKEAADYIFDKYDAESAKTRKK